MQTTEAVQRTYGRRYTDGVSERTSDPAGLAAWKAEGQHGYKTDIMEQLAKACGYGTKLVQHWVRDRINPAAVEFFEACKLCNEYELPGYFLGGTVLEDWYAGDWRGKKAQAPTPMQLFERALMVHGRLEAEREADAHRAPVAKRVSALDAEPAAGVYDTGETVI